MNFSSKYLRTGLLCLSFVMLSFSYGYAQDSEFSFKVVIHTDSTIKKLLVSVDGKKYNFFDVGTGIAAGKAATMVWNKASDSDPCKQWVKAVYADKSESTPVKFDFCEEDLELEFTD